MRRIVLASSILLTLTAALAANCLAEGKIKGLIRDRESGEPLVGANVVILGTTSGGVANVGGEFSILHLPAGTYTLKASYVGYASVTISNVEVNNELTSEVNFDMASQAVQLQAVEIVAERPLVLKNATNAVRIVNSDDLKNIPLRGITNILAIQPGVVVQDGQVMIRGGRPDEVGYYIEGISVKSPTYDWLGVTVLQEALEEIQVLAGGYSAEYGGANSGLVQQQFKTGTAALKANLEYWTDNVSFAGKNSRYSGDKRLGAYWFGYNQFTASLSGPAVSERIKVFGLFGYTYNRATDPKAYPGIDIGPIKDPSSGDSINFVYPAGPLVRGYDQRFTGTGTATIDLSPVNIRLSGTLTDRTVMTAPPVTAFLDVDRYSQTNVRDGMASLKLTHVLSPSVFYELKGGLYGLWQKEFDPILGDNFYGYGDSVVNAHAGRIWRRLPNEPTGRYNPPRTLSIYGFTFVSPDRPVAQYLKSARTSLTLGGALNFLLGRYHTVKAGMDYQRLTLRMYQIGNPRSLASMIAANAALADTDPNKVTLAELLVRDGINNYGYDVFGVSNESDDFLGPRHPVFASAYIQDKIEYDDLVANLGLRFDYIDRDSYTFIDPAHPELTQNFQTNEVDPSGMRKVAKLGAVTPRIGFAYPVSDRTVFHAQFAKFIQQSRLRDLFVGWYTGPGCGGTVGYDLRPTRTTQYEIGFRQQIGDFAALDITGFYKDEKDQIVTTRVVTDRNSPYGTYLVLGNGDFATVKGLEATFRMHRTKRMLASASISLQQALGTGSTSGSSYGYVFTAGAAMEPYYPRFISPLDYDNAVRGSVLMDYRFGREEGGSWLEDLGASILLQFSSGHPYTLTSIATYIPQESVNSSTTPWTFQADLRIDKTFWIGDRLGLGVSLYIVNLFDNRNVLNVYSETGDAYDDGWLSDPSSGGQYVKTFGPIYERLYRAINLDYGTNYGPPRQIRLGFRLEY